MEKPPVEGSVLLDFQNDEAVNSIAMCNHRSFEGSYKSVISKDISTLSNSFMGPIPTSGIPNLVG